MKRTNNHAISHSKLGNLAQTKKLHKGILKKSPNNADSLHILGRISVNQGNTLKGMQMIKRAILIAPLHPLYHEALATALYQMEDFESAAIECRLALRLDPEMPEPLNILGLVAREKGNYHEAIQFFSEAMEKRIPYSDAMNNLSTVLIRMGDYETAEKYQRLVIDLEPTDDRAWNNLGLSLRGKGMFYESKQAFLKASKYPPSRVNLAHILLLEGDLKKGFSLYEHRKKILGIGKQFHKPEWNGRPHQQKTLLLIHEQGLGDTIMMSRFFSDLTKYFKKVIVKVQKPLVEIMETIDPHLSIITDSEGVAFDYWCPLMSLPFRLNIDNKAKIPQTPWFKLPKIKRDDKKLRVGVNWAGNPSYKYDFVRSTHLEKLEMLLKVKDVEWYSLHKGHLEAEADHYKLLQPLVSANNFYDTAQFINGLDLVISTETAVPNLSAALGIPTCVLTTSDYDWRWASWYKDVHVCAQEIQGNWFGSIYKALEVLNKMIVATQTKN